MLYNMLYTMLCNMIHNVLHNMLLRAKNPPSHSPLPWSGSASLQCPFIQQLLVGLALIIGEGHATFRLGSSAAAVGRSGVRGGEALASTAPAAQSFLGGYLLYQASILPTTYFMQGLAGFVVNFIQLLHGAGVPVQEVKPGINHGILSLHEEGRSKEARQTGHIILDSHGTSCKLGQSNAPVAGPRCVMI
jgi:hypothetical protein